MSRIRRSALLAPLLTLGLALSGCAVTGTGFQPGVAATVGDRTISTDRVDTLTTDFCSAIESADQPQAQMFPLGLLRSQVAQQLMLRAAADDLAERYDLETGPGYEQQIAQLKTATAQLSQDEQEAVILVEGNQAYLTDLLTTVGTRLLEEEGRPSEDPNAAVLRGQDELFATLRAEGEINPIYDTVITENGQLERGGRDVSSAAEGGPLGAQPDQPDPAYVASLPASQRCG